MVNSALSNREYLDSLRLSLKLMSSKFVELNSEVIFGKIFNRKLISFYLKSEFLPVHSNLGKNEINSANLSVSERDMLFANETCLTIFKENPFKNRDDPE